MDTTGGWVEGPPVGWRASAWGAGGGATALGAATVLGRQAVTAWASPVGPDPGTAVLAAVLALATGLLLWVAGVLLVAAWRVRPAAGPARVPPTASTSVRVATTVLVLLATGAGGTGAVAATVCTTAPTAQDDRPGAVEPSPDGPVPPRHDPVDVPLPGWTPVPATPQAHPRGQVDLVGGRGVAQGDLPDHVVVRRGDTLWDLAARHLGPGATSADVAEEWPRWYAANLATIGPDPDLLLPGQELTVPGTPEDGP